MGDQSKPGGFGIAPDDLAYLRQWADESERELDDVLSEAVGRFVQWRREFDTAIEAGLEDVRAGRLVSHEAMLAHRAEQRRKAGRA